MSVSLLLTFTVILRPPKSGELGTIEPAGFSLPAPTRMPTLHDSPNHAFEIWRSCFPQLLPYRRVNVA